MHQLQNLYAASLINRFTIILLIVLLISILSITSLWFVGTKNQIETEFVLHQNHTEQILLQSVIWIDGGIRLYEYSYEPGIREATERFLAAYTKAGGNIDEIDLFQLKKEYNQTFGGEWDLYIVNDKGIVKKATYTPDVNLNFSKYPTFFNTLTRIRKNNEYVIDRTVKGFVKGSPHRKFAYQGTPDAKYILEISRNFKNFIPSEIKMSYAELLRNLPGLNQEIKSIELYNVQGDVVSKWNAGNQFSEITPDSKQSIIRVLSSKTSISNIEENQQISSYIFLPIKDIKYPSSPMMNLAARIIYSTAGVHHAVLEISIIYILTLIFTLLIALLAVQQMSKLFSKPVKDLIGDLNQIAEGELDHQIRKTGILELEQIESAINQLVKNLKATILSLRDQEKVAQQELLHRIKSESNIRKLLQEVQEKEKQIQESEKRYRSVVETQKEFICRFTPDGTHIFVNDAYCRFFGKKCSDILGTKFHPEIPNGEIRQIKGHFSSLTPKCPIKLNEHHIILPNGEKHFVQWIDQAIFSDNGIITEYQSVGRDLTDLKDLERSLHTSDAMYRETVNAMDAGLFVSDRAHTIIISNGWKRGKEAGLLKSHENLVGKNLLSILAFLTEKEFREYEKVFNTGITLVSEKTIQNKKVNTVETKIIPIINDGKVTMVVTLIRDVSAQKQAENALQKLNRDLEGIIRKRTADLQVSLDELDAFAYSVSHDLRAPVRAIDGFSHLLLMNENSLGEESRHLVAKIREGVMTMDHLIQDLLRFSRTSRQPLQVVDTDMAGLVRGVITELTSQEGSKNISITITDLHPSEGDPALLRQVWYNLISNSIKFTPAGSTPDITIGSYEKEKNIIYYIKDKGIGFDMQCADKIFEVFSRLCQSPDIEGTGVGLALVKRIILRHHGRIWVQSRKGRGTTFYFTVQGTNGNER